MTVALCELEKYINLDESEPDVLIRAALIHYQFETIHPFLDGNGRIGRLLIILYLIQKQILQKPVLYISYFLKLNRLDYYERLTMVRNSGNYEQWVRFFIQALYQTVDDSLITIEKLIALREKNRNKIAGLGRSAKSARQVYEYIEKSPIIDIGKTSNELQLPFTTVSRAVERLCQLGILRLTETVKRNRCFAYEEYLVILRKDT
jgi:Fic family protein